MQSSRAVSFRTMAFLLAGLSMFGPFAIDAVFPAFPQIGRELGADKVAMQQVISVYLLAYAFMSLLHGALSDALGRKRVIVVGLVVFILASVGCALSRDMGTLLFFRGLQGLSAGVGYIIGRAVIRDLYDGADAQRLMSQVSMIFSIAPAIAPIVGGWLLGWSNWMAIFWFLVAFSVVLLVITWRWLPETHPPHLRQPLHAVSLARDYASIGGNPRFLRLAAAGSFAFGGLFLYIASAPAFVMDLLRLNEQQFAWLFIPTIGGMALGAFVSGRSAGKLSADKAVRLGYACIAVATLYNVGYNALAPQMSVPWAVLPMMLMSFGIALLFPPLTLAILDMYPRLRGSASSMQAFSTLITNAVIAGVLSPMLSGSGLALALGAGGFALVSWVLFRWERHVVRSKMTQDAADPGQ
jgi:DHA1 family bicyclomycin/chloramphenicol resistance-like MFS transporter